VPEFLVSNGIGAIVVLAILVVLTGVGVRASRNGRSFKFWGIEIGPQVDKGAQASQKETRVPDDLAEKIGAYDDLIRRRNMIITALGSNARCLAKWLVDDARSPMTAPEELYRQLFGLMIQAFDLKQGAWYRVATFTPDPNEPRFLSIHWASGFSPEDIDRLRIPLESSIRGRLFLQGNRGDCHYDQDIARRGSGYWRDPAETQSQRTLFSICIDGAVIGKAVLSVEVTIAKGLSDDDIDAIRVFAGFMELNLAARAVSLGPPGRSVGVSKEVVDGAADHVGRGQ